jgi:hypothetical protein
MLQDPVVVVATNASVFVEMGAARALTWLSTTGTPVPAVRGSGSAEIFWPTPASNRLVRSSERVAVTMSERTSRTRLGALCGFARACESAR